MIGCHVEAWLPIAAMKTRMSAANPPTLAMAAMYPVMGLGAPWYTSGVHTWKGTAATLKPNPTNNSAIPA